MSAVTELDPTKGGGGLLQPLLLKGGVTALSAYLRKEEPALSGAWPR